MNLLQRSHPPQFTYRVRVTAGQTTTPKFTYVAGYPPAFIDWGDGADRTASTSGTEYTHAYTLAGEYTVTLVMPNQAKWLSQVDISSDKVIQVVTPIQIFKAIQQFKALTNAAWVQNISSWVLPAGLKSFYVDSAAISGDISGWVLPAGLTNFYVSSAAISGDISGWVLPAGLTYFSADSTAVSGNISGWVLPAGLTNFYVSSTAVSGNISGWVLPAGLTSFYVNSTAISGCVNLTVMVSIQTIRADNCALPQATVDAYLAGCWAREAATTYATPTLNLGGTNAAPSAAGTINKNNLIGAVWIVTTS